MDINVKIFVRKGISIKRALALGKKIENFIETLGFNCYGTGYDLEDKYREIVFKQFEKEEKR